MPTNGELGIMNREYVITIRVARHLAVGSARSVPRAAAPPPARHCGDPPGETMLRAVAVFVGRAV